MHKLALTALFCTGSLMALVACGDDNNKGATDASVDHAAEDGAAGDALGADGEAGIAAHEDAGDAGDAADAMDAADTAADADAADAATLTDNQIVGVVEAANIGEIQEALLAQGEADGGIDAGAVSLGAGFDAGVARSNSPAVLAFAAMMISDHSESNTAIGALGIAATTSPVQEEVQATASTGIRALSPLSGNGFDVAYTQAQVANHQTVITLVNNVLLPSAHSAPLKTFLSSALLPQLQMHLTDARALLAELADGGADASSE